jgi:hypothetical protein
MREDREKGANADETGNEYQYWSYGRKQYIRPKRRTQYANTAPGEKAFRASPARHAAIPSTATHRS